jgi:hypothetical protein
MKDTHAYWAIRLLLSVGLALLLLGNVVYAAGGPSEVFTDTDESGPIFVPVLLGTTVGAIWDIVVASAIASYAVYGSIHFAAPPLFESPRDRFTDTSPTTHRRP